MDKIYEDGSLGGIRDNGQAKRFKERREDFIENWEDSVECKEKELQKEKQKLYFAQAEVIAIAAAAITSSNIKRPMAI